MNRLHGRKPGRKYALGYIFLFFLVSALVLNIIAEKQRQDFRQHAGEKLMPAVISKIIWPAFAGGGSRTNINNSETTITPSTVGNLKFLWKVALPYTTNGSPVEAPNITTPSGTKDLVFITTQRGSLVALDAATGIKVWQADSTGNFVNSQGTSSSPAIDPSGQFIYSYGLDGKIHKYAITTGTESISGGFPATVTLQTNVEKISSPINIGNGYLYVTTSGYDGDFGTYVGHVVAVNLAIGTTTVFNSLCANIHQLFNSSDCGTIQSGIWGRGGAVIDPITHNVYVVTGNGNYDANTGGNNYGDSLIELSPDLLHILDTYTPTTYSSLDSQDADLGSAAPIMLPDQAGSTTPHLAVLGGKDNRVRLINRDNLSGQGGPNHVGGELQTPLSVSANVFSHGVAWNDANNVTWVFVTDMGNNLYAYKVITTAGNTQLVQQYQKSGIGKNSPFMVNNILFVPASSSVKAIDPTTGNILWNSNQTSAGGTIGSLHWQSPIVVNGSVFMPDNAGNMFSYALASVSPTITPSATPTSTPSPIPSPTPTPTATPTVLPTNTSTPTPTYLTGDINHSGCINILDFNAWLQAYQGHPVAGTFPDINNDGTTDILDFNAWLTTLQSLYNNNPNDPRLCTN